MTPNAAYRTVYRMTNLERGERRYKGSSCAFAAREFRAVQDQRPAPKPDPAVDAEVNARQTVLLWPRPRTHVTLKGDDNHEAARRQGMPQRPQLRHFRFRLRRREYVGINGGQREPCRLLVHEC